MSLNLRSEKANLPKGRDAKFRIDTKMTMAELPNVRKAGRFSILPKTNADIAGGWDETAGSVGEDFDRPFWQYVYYALS